MNRQQSEIKLIALAGLLSVFLFSGAFSLGRDFDARLNSIVKPHRFSIAGWEFRTLVREAGQWISGGSEEIDDEASIVIEYFSSVERIKALKSEIEAASDYDKQGNLASLEAELNKLQERITALQGVVERIMTGQITEVLTEQGIFNPVDKYIRSKFSFPPLNFKLEEPPYLLVISPRDRIEGMRGIPLRQDTSLDEMEDIETEVDKLGVSSLVVGLGGYATYPSLVTHDASLGFTVDAVIEEWLHQYLFFKPLGFRYVLHLTGVSPDYEIVTMNETLASMVAKELGSIIRSKYYPQYGNDDAQTPQSGFDFNREMREIRRTVDQYLAQGEVEQAEKFMEQKRQFLVSKGYNIRKLNQAYFAFHGNYADSLTSISPIGVELKELRNRSASLKDFLDTAAAMANHQALRDMLSETPDASYQEI